MSREAKNAAIKLYKKVDKPIKIIPWGFFSLLFAVFTFFLGKCSDRPIDKVAYGALRYITNAQTQHQNDSTSTWIYTSTLDSIAQSFSNEYEFEYLYFLDYSSSVNENGKEEDYSDAKEILKNNLYGKYENKSILKEDLKTLLLSYLINDLGNKYIENEDAYFEVRSNNNIVRTVVNQDNIRKAVNDLCKASNISTVNFDNEFSSIKKRIEAINKNTSKKKKFFIITVISDFEIRKKDDKKKVASLLDLSLPNCKIQYNLLVLPDGNNELPSLVKEIKSKVRINDLYIYDDLHERVVNFNEKRVDEEKTCLQFWIESIHAPTIKTNKEYNITPNNKLHFYPDASIKHDNRSDHHSKEFYISLIDGIDNKDEKATIKFQSWRLDTSLVPLYTYQRDPITLSLNTTKARCINLYPYETLKIEKWSDKSPNPIESELFLRMYQKDERFQFSIPLEFSK